MFHGVEVMYTNLVKWHDIPAIKLLYLENYILISIMKTSYIFLADGFEELEALSPIDIMRRAGMPVVTVAIRNDGTATGAHGVTVEADTTIDKIKDKLDMASIEWLVCPGGMPGATNLYESAPLGDMLSAHYKSGGKVAAICASPAIVFAPLGIIDNREATCYPGMEGLCVNAHMVDKYVVVSDNVVTGQGPAAAIPFGLKLVELSLGKEVADNVAAGMLVGRH